MSITYHGRTPESWAEVWHAQQKESADHFIKLSSLDLYPPCPECGYDIYDITRTWVGQDTISVDTPDEDVAIYVDYSDNDEGGELNGLQLFLSCSDCTTRVAKMQIREEKYISVLSEMAEV